MKMYFIHILSFCITTKSSQYIMQIILINYGTFFSCSVVTEEDFSERFLCVGSPDNDFIIFSKICIFSPIIRAVIS